MCFAKYLVSLHPIAMFDHCYKNHSRNIGHDIDLLVPCYESKQMVTGQAKMSISQYSFKNIGNFCCGLLKVK